MYDIAQRIVNKWKEIIESYSIPVRSVDLFRMDKYYTGYPEIKYCYKVNFTFNDGLFESNVYKKDQLELINKFERLLDELVKNFSYRFEPILVDTNQTNYNSGETKFHNNKVDYMTNQGYRLIIQFYPQGFIDELREDKLNQLGII
jgi:hypothetical protein